MKNKNNGKPWTSDDHYLLAHFAGQGYSARETAAALGRTLGATKWVAMQCRISFKSINQRSTQKKLGRKRIRTGDMRVTL